MRCSGMFSFLEVYYETLKSDAGDSIRRAFGVGNEIARSIEFLSSQMNKSVTIEEMATQDGMSHAVFHRKPKRMFGQSPKQWNHSKPLQMNMQ